MNEHPWRHNPIKPTGNHSSVSPYNYVRDSKSTPTLDHKFMIHKAKQLLFHTSRLWVHLLCSNSYQNKGTVKKEFLLIMIHQDNSATSTNQEYVALHILHEARLTTFFYSAQTHCISLSIRLWLIPFPLPSQNMTACILNGMLIYYS